MPRKVAISYLKTMKTGLLYYLVWTIPSSFSLLASTLMLLNILLSPSLRSHQYQQMCLILAASDIIQCLSGMMGPKSSAEFSMCIVREYMLIVSSLIEAFATVVICCVTWKIFRSLTAVPKRQFYVLVGIVMCVLPLLCILLFAHYRGFDVFCLDHGQSRKSDIAYYTTFILPIFGCVIVDFVFYFMIKRRFREIVSQENSSEAVVEFYRSNMLKTVRRLILFPIIFAVGWLMEIVLITYMLLGDDEIFSEDPVEIVLISLASLSVSLIGVGVAVVYFRQQRVLAPPIRCVFQIIRMMGCSLDWAKSDLRSTKPKASSMPSLPPELADPLVEISYSDDLEEEAEMGVGASSSMFSIDMLSINDALDDSVVLVK